VAELPELLLSDASEWREWLAEHHSDHAGVWPVLHKKGGRTTALTCALALDEALCFGWIDGQLGVRDDETYRQRFTPRRANSPWSARNVGHVTRLAEAGRMQPAGTAAVEAAQANAQPPADLLAALAANPVAAATFETLDAAHRYAIIYRLNSVMQQATRERKLAQYIDMLARGESPIRR
jgi:uncharacterized protein YdeI (YjbR/CyaY-like superfamily)